MEIYHKIQTLFKRDMDGSITGKKGKMMEGEWTTPELEYLADKEWEFTEKVDGTNIRVWYRPTVATSQGFMPCISLAGRTDNAVIPKPLFEALGTMFSHEKFAEVFPDVDAHGVILFGEGYGPKIQGGGKYRDDTSFVLFDVKIGDFWLSRDNVDDIASKLGIESVPVIGQGTLWQAINIIKDGWGRDLAGNLIMSKGDPGYLRSQWGDFEAEGIVARPVVDLFNRKGERIITKIKAVDFR